MGLLWKTVTCLYVSSSNYPAIHFFLCSSKLSQIRYRLHHVEPHSTCRVWNSAGGPFFVLLSFLKKGYVCENRARACVCVWVFVCLCWCVYVYLCVCVCVSSYHSCTIMHTGLKLSPSAPRIVDNRQWIMQ